MLNEAVRVEVFRVNDAAVHIGENFEFIGTTDVVAIAGGAVADDALIVHIAHLVRFKRLDHPVLLCHTTDPFI